MKSPLLLTALTLVSLTLFGCSTTTKQDPLESFNRTMFGFNEGVDKAVLKPVAKSYTFITPDFVELGISNFFDNLFYPTVVINQLLQGKIRLAVQDTGRFIFNTTFGVAGLFDVSSKLGLEEHREDFGQTLAVWGTGSGAYIVLPLLGSTTVRGGVGKVADVFTNPLFYVEEDATKYSLFGLSVVDTRAELLKAEKLVMGDKYLFVRDAYLQRRAYLINDNKIEESDPFLSE